MWRDYLDIKPINETQVLLNNKIIKQFCSTSYLTLNWNLAFQKKLQTLLSPFNPSLFTSFGSNYLGGTHSSKTNLEAIVAEECGFETSIAFASGWNANFAIANYLGETYDLIISDSKSHNSIITGLKSYKHKVSVVNIDELKDEDILNLPYNRIALIFPSIEGITGIHTKINLSKKVLERLTVVSDESHSFGMFGDRGLDSIQPIKLDIRLLGFSKALGHFGALICASNNVRTWIEQNASIWIFSTPLPPYIWDINKLLFNFIQTMSNERKSILNKNNYLRNCLDKYKLTHTGNNHITGLHLPETTNSPEFERYLIDQNMFLKVSGYPSVPKGKLICRITANQYHSEQDIDQLVKAIQNYFIK